MARFNEALDEDQQMLFRIGVHLGEVIFDEEGHDLFGDGVNLAARIQVMAEPGGWIVYWNTTTKGLTVHKPETFERGFQEDTRAARLRSTTEKGAREHAKEVEWVRLKREQ